MDVDQSSAFAYAANTIGASTDERMYLLNLDFSIAMLTMQVKLIFSFLVSYPLAGLLKRIPDNRPDLKNVFSISISLFYLVGLFDLWAGIRTLLVSSISAYLIAAYVSGPLMPWISFVVLMGHMSINHIHRHYVNDASLVDITGAQMVLIMKLTAFCWNVHDGRLPDDTLSDYQKAHAVRKLPSILNYTGYVFFFPSLFAGPAFDYVDYRAWLEGTMFELPPGTDPSKAPPTRKKRKIPRSGTPATIKAITGLVWLFAFLKFNSWYYPDAVLDKQYLTFSLPRRIFILHMVGLTTRMKYYAVWSMTEGACILSGIGYAGIDSKTGRADWSRLQNVNPLGIELAQNTRAYLGNWNMNTNSWLRNYVYLRVTPKGKKPGFRASMATFVTSAFWHGFEPGYYLSFVLASFLQTIAKNARRFLRPFVMELDGKTPITGGNFLTNKRAYDVASWAITQLAFSFTVAPFILLSMDRCLTAWARVYFYCIIGTVLSMAFFASPGKAWLKKKLDKRNARLEGKLAGSRPKIGREESYAGPVGGLPDDPAKELDEMMEEIRQEVDLRRRKGMSVKDGLQEAVRERLRDGQSSIDATRVEIDGEKVRLLDRPS